jgi:hypothetical protein
MNVSIFMEKEWYRRAAETLSIPDYTLDHELFEWSKRFPLCISLPLFKLKKLFPKYNYEHLRKECIRNDPIFDDILVDEKYINFFLDLNYILKLFQNNLISFEGGSGLNEGHRDFPEFNSVIIIGILEGDLHNTNFGNFSCISMVNYEYRWYCSEFPLMNIRKILIALQKTSDCSKWFTYCVYLLLPQIF